MYQMPASLAALGMTIDRLDVVVGSADADTEPIRTAIAAEYPGVEIAIRAAATITRCAVYTSRPGMLSDDVVLAVNADVKSIIARYI